MYALRAATTIDANDARLLTDAGAELLRALVERNGLEPSQLVSGTYSCTPDLDAAFPAAGARAAGFDGLPMLCVTEMAVRGAPQRVVRLLLLVDGTPPPGGPRHAYLGAARALRPDWAGEDGRR